MSMAMYVAVILCLLKMVSAELVLQTRSGMIQGVTSTSRDVEAFLGIPFAEPPVGDLRFAKPVPKKPWTDIFNASKLSPPCAQVCIGLSYYYLPDITNMSEDCLYLNLWAPKPILNDTLKPIVIFIHPGGFMIGTSSMKIYDGANFAKRGNIIVVTINYRIGPFGYFLAHIEEADGNMGMHDQVMAIRWVKENAVHFGGDPENIVLMGESAGAQSVAAHILSPISKNLFQKAIIQSGSMIIPHYFENNTKLFRNSEALSSSVGCSNETMNLSTNPHLVVNCLKRQTVKDILKSTRSLAAKSPYLFFPRTIDEFMPTAPIKLLHKGKFSKDIPVLTGINNDEGTLILASGPYEKFGMYGDNIAQSIGESFVKAILRVFFRMADISEPSEIQNFYLSQVKDKTLQGYVKTIADVVGDYILACNTIFQADFLSLENPVYFYKFGFRAASTPMAEWVGVTHLDELQYILGNPYHKNFTEEEVKLHHHLLDRWIAFVRTGNPNLPGELPWLQYTYQKPYYLSIEQDEESIRMKPMERCKIWRKIFDSVISPQV